MALSIGPWKPPGQSEVETAAVVGCLRIGMTNQNPPSTKTAVAMRALLEEWIKVPKTAVLVAKAATGQVQGVMVFRNEGNHVRIVFIAALEPRRGVGSQLVTALRDLCSKKGVKELRATYSEKDERARAFYTKKMGFVDQGPAGATAEGFPLVEAVLAVPAAAPA